MSRRQKGRKPRKSWHKFGAAAKHARATRGWPTGVGSLYDGEPTPLRQGHAKRRRMAS